MSYKETSSGQICIGDIVDVNHDTSAGYIHGWAPVTTDIPDMWNFNNFKSALSEKVSVLDNNLLDKITAFCNGNYATRTDIKDAFYTLYPEIDENVIMIWGNLYEGGIGLARYDNDNCVLLGCKGVMSDGTYLHSNISQNICPYKVQITNNGQHQDLIAANVQASGLYDNGFFICQVWEMIYTVPSIAKMTDSYRVFTNAIVCDQSYGTEVAEIPVYAEVTFNASFENCVSDYLNSYTNEMPDESTLGALTNYRYIIARLLQRKFYTLPSIVYDYELYNTVDGTNVFGGADSNPPESPYGPSSTSSSGGGYGGSQTRYSEPNGDEGLPSDNGLDTGFFALYNPTKAELQDFTQFLFARITENIAAVIKRTLTNPLDGVLSAHMVHFKPPTNALQTIYFCGFSSGCQAFVISSRWHEIKYQFSFNKKTILMFETFHDFHEKTKMSLFLPYSGMHEMDINEFLNGVMTVTYKIDMLSGDCYIQVEAKTPNVKNGTLIDSVVYTFTGNCASPVPLSALDYRNFISASLGAIGSVMSGNIIGAASSIASASYGVNKTGSINCNIGYLGKQTPFVVIHHPEISIPNNFNDYRGYPSNITSKIKNAGDFVIASKETVWTNNIHCTDLEMQKIKELFEKGVWTK